MTTPTTKPPSGGPLAAVAATLGSAVAIAILSGARESPLTPALPPGAGASAPLSSIADLLGLSAAPTSLRAGAAVLLLVAAGGAFLLTAREAWRGALSLRTIIALALLLHALAVLVPLLGSHDVYSYIMYGRIDAVYGRNPYLAPPSDFAADPLFRFVSPEWRDTPTVYGPVFLWIASWIARTAGDPSTAIVWFKALAGLSSVATMLLVAYAARRIAPQRAAFAVVVVGLNPTTIYSAVGGGHADTLVALGVAAAFALLAMGDGRNTRRSAPLATGALALAALVKVVAALPLALLVGASTWTAPRGRRWRVLALHTAIIAGLTVAFGIRFAQSRDLTYGISSLAPYGSYFAPWLLATRTLAPFGGIVAGTSGIEATVVAVRLAFVLALAIPFLWVLREAGRTDRVAQWGARWSSMLLLAPLSLQLLFPWYVVWCLPVAWLLAPRLRTAALVLSAFFPTVDAIADRFRAPVQYDGLRILGFYVLAPALLILLLWLLVTLRRETRAGERESSPRVG